MWLCHRYNFIFFMVYFQSTHTYSISNEWPQKFVHGPSCILSWCCPNHKLLFYISEFPIFYTPLLTKGIKNQKFRKQKLELMDMGAPRLNICKTMHKFLRQFIRNWMSTSTSKMDQEWRWNCGSSKVMWKIQ